MSSSQVAGRLWYGKMAMALPTLTAGSGGRKPRSKKKSTAKKKKEGGSKKSKKSRGKDGKFSGKDGKSK